MYARKGRDADQKYYDLFMLEVQANRDDDTQEITSVITGRECNLTYDKGDDNAAGRIKDLQPHWRGDSVVFLRHTATACDDIYLMNVEEFRDSLQSDTEACPPTISKNVDGDEEEEEEEENIPNVTVVKVFSDACVNRSRPTLSPIRQNGTQHRSEINTGRPE